MKPVARLPLMLLTEKVVWFGFAIVLAAMSVVSDSINSLAWMWLSGALYTLLAISLILIIAGSEHRFGYWSRQRWWIIILALLSLLWLYLQIVLPYQNPLYSLLLSDPSAPEWLQPSVVISTSPSATSWWLAAQIPAVVCLLLTVLLVNSRRRLRQMLYLFCALAVIHSAVAIAYKFSGEYLIDKILLDGHWSAARGWFPNRNHLSAFLVLMMFGPLTVLVRSLLASNRAIDWFIVVSCTSLTFLAVVLSQSRAGIICFIFIVVAALTIPRMLSFTAKRNQKPFVRGKALFMASIVSAGLLMLFGQEIIHRLGNLSLAFGERGLQWKITLEAIQQSPWVGYGGGSYASVFQYFRGFADLRQVIFDQSHNDYLHIFLEQGLIGLTLWLMFLGLVLRGALRSALRSKSSLVAATISAAALVVAAAMAQSMVDFNLQIVNLRCFFFVIIGLILCAPAISHSSKN